MISSPILPSWEKRNNPGAPKQLFLCPHHKITRFRILNPIPTMYHRYLIAITRPLWLGISLALLSSGTMNAGVAERYIEAQLQVVRSLEKRLDNLADVADESAARLVAGGNIYLAGEPGMVSELLGRAGGPCGAKALALEKPLPLLSRNDIVLLSDYGTPGKLAAALEKLKSADALVIVFASFENPLARRSSSANLRFVPVDIPMDSFIVRFPGRDAFIPTVSPAITTAEWTFFAELLGACRRQHKQLAIYLSIFLDEGRARYNRTKGLMFEPDFRPESVPRGQFAQTFLTRVRQSLEAIRGGEMENLRKATVWFREATAARKHIARSLMGHLPPIEAGIRGDVNFFTHTSLLTIEKGGGAWIRENLGDGDVALFLAYQNEDVLTASANALGARTIALTSAAPGPEQARNPRHLYINPHWPITDGVLELPGYDVKACPLSTILNMTCYYAIVGEVIAPAKSSP